MSNIVNVDKPDSNSESGSSCSDTEEPNRTYHANTRLHYSSDSS